MTGPSGPASVDHPVGVPVQPDRHRRSARLVVIVMGLVVVAALAARLVAPGGAGPRSANVDATSTPDPYAYLDPRYEACNMLPGETTLIRQLADAGPVHNVLLGGDQPAGQPGLLLIGRGVQGLSLAQGGGLFNRYEGCLVEGSPDDIEVHHFEVDSGTVIPLPDGPYVMP